MKKITVGLVQMKMAEDSKKNLEKAVKMCEEAARKGTEIICLPELFRTPYFPQTEDIKNFKLAETIPGESTEVLAKLAKAKKVVIIAGLFEKRTPGLHHNTAVILDTNGTLVGKYRKMHIPHDPCFFEKYYFSPGDTGFHAIETHYGKIGTMICWDQWYPEGARLTALEGAQILFYPTAIGWFTDDPPNVRKEVHDAWETIQRSHAIANGVYVCAVNRVGVEGKLEFFGASFVADPFGKVTARASHNKEEVIVVDCDLEKIGDTREQWPFLRDRRIDEYAGILKRFHD